MDYIVYNKLENSINIIFTSISIKYKKMKNNIDKILKNTIIKSKIYWKSLKEGNNMNDINQLITYLLTPTAQVALIMAMAELAKKIGLKKKFIPLVDLVLGLLSGIFVYSSLGIVQSIVVGLALGLSACGLFSGIKNLSE